MIEPHSHDKDLLLRYLLGQSPRDEAARCDQLSITDDDFAARLADVENDLVDSYVRGQLSGDQLESFRLILRSSPTMRENVDFAIAFLQVADNRSYRPPVAPIRETKLPGLKPARFWFWGLAGAAGVALIAISSFLAAQNLQLRKQVDEERRDRAALEQRIHELQAKADQTTSPPPVQPVKLSFTLAPQLRGSGALPQITVPRGTERVTFNLRLEIDDFPAYQVELHAPASGTILWRSENLKSTTAAQRRIVACDLPAGLLAQQSLTLELSGIRPGAAPEFVSDYSFQPVLQ